MAGTVATSSKRHSGEDGVTTGRYLLHNVDGRGTMARRYRDLLDRYTTEFAIVDESDLSLARRAATISVQLEQQEARLLNHEPVNNAEMATATNTLRRLIFDLRKSARRRGAIR
jgi:hypothetical protein